MEGVTVKTVSVSYGRTLNLGNFSSARLEETLWADVAEGVDLDEVQRFLWGMVKAQVREQAMPFLRKVREEFLEAIASLPEEDRQRFAEMLDNPNLDMICGA